MIQLHGYNFCHPHFHSLSKESTFMSTKAMPFFQLSSPQHFVSSASYIASRLKTPHRTTENVTSFLIVIVIIDPHQQVSFLATPSSMAPRLTGLHFCHQISSRYAVPWQTWSLMKTLPKGIKRWDCMFYICSRVLLLVIYITASEYSKGIYKCHHWQRLFVHCS